MSVSQKNKKNPRTGYLVLIGFFISFIWFYQILNSASVYNQIRYLMWIGWEAHVVWTFSSGSNAGTLIFEARPTDGYSGAHVYIPDTSGPMVLTGSFWSETIGWISLRDVEMNHAYISENIWSLSGYAWSENAWWVDFSWVTYHLSNTSFSWYAWNDSVWWLDMSKAFIEMTSSGAIGKVKIIWTLWGNRIFDTIYGLDGTISPITTTKIINEVRKNVAIITRNIPDTSINSDLISNNVFDNADTQAINGMLIFRNDSNIGARVNYTDSIQTRFENISATSPVYSVIALGADIYLDDSVYVQQDEKPRVIIALKNEQWFGWNIYIDGSITQIYSSLIAEGNLYSGRFTWSTPVYYNNDASSLFKIPNRQLYVYGSTISNNTIGGYGVDNGTTNSCPYNIQPCTDNTALLYDFNHFRDFQKDALDVTLLRGYQPPWEGAPLDTYDDYSMIIEHDPRILSSPPPGLERIR